MTRQELFEQVWKEPVSKVAETYHLSGSGLRKICLTYDIPVPPRGYWAKVQAGHQMKRPRLPEPQTAGTPVYLPQRTAPVKLQAKPPETSLVAAQRAFEAEPRNRIVVPAVLERPHAWARGVATGILQGKVNYRNTVELDVSGGLIAVEVSPALADRAALIVDALGRALDHRKFEVGPAWPPNSYRAQGHGSREKRFLVDGAVFRFRLVERTRKTKVRPGERPRRESQLWREMFGDSSYSNNYEPTGELRLTLIGSLAESVQRGYSGGDQKHFVDSPGKPLEVQLNDVMLSVWVMASKLRAEKVKLDEANRIRENEWNRQQELLRQKQLEGQRLQALEGLADRHSRAERLRQLIAAVRESGVAPGPAGSPEGFEEWAKWASDYADHLDPVTPGKRG